MGCEKEKIPTYYFECRLLFAKWTIKLMEHRANLARCFAKDVAKRRVSPFAAYPPFFQNGNVMKDERRRIYTRPAFPKTDRRFPRLRSKIPARFRAASNPVAHLWPHVFRVPWHYEYNTLHFASQSRVPKGYPFGNPGHYFGST